MFDYEPPKEKSSADWSGTIIGVMLLPVFFVFVYLGKAELGFTACIVLAMSMIAVRLRWKLRKYLYFGGAIGFVLFLNIPILFWVHWPQTNVPTIAYSMPFGIVDFLLIMGAINLAQKIFSDDPSADDENE